MNGILASIVVAALTTAIISWCIEVWRRGNERNRKLYGPLKYKLLAMRALTKNRETLMQEILDQGGSIEMKNEALGSELKPLIEKWQAYKNEIVALFEKYPDCIRKCDFDLVGRFIDACIKRDISKEGQSRRALYNNRMDKIIETIKQMQSRFLD